MSMLRSTSPALNVGRYNSPHLSTVTDCIIINDKIVGDDLYYTVQSEVERVNVEHDVKLTSFELLTLTALQIFERTQVDVAVVEVGLGGRLDATNIIPDDAILVSALTNVGLDHQTFLGSTVSAIATEKLGIARRGKPFVIGPQKYPEVVDVGQKILLSKGCELVPLISVRELGVSTPPRLSFSPAEFHPPPGTKIGFSLFPFPDQIVADLPLRGDHQLENVTTALTVISALFNKRLPKASFAELLTPCAVARGIGGVQWEGRLSFHRLPPPRSLPVLVDGAHNPASAAALTKYISQILSVSTDPTIDVTYILALSNSPPKTPHDVLSLMLPPILPNKLKERVRIHVALLRFSPPDGMPWIRVVSPSEMADVVSKLIPGADVWIAAEDEQPNKSLSSAVAWAEDHTKDAGLVVVAGSLYLVSDFYRAYVRKSA
jgi:folylpolyglutamate synthase